MSWMGHIGAVIAIFFSGLFGGHASAPPTTVSLVHRVATSSNATAKKASSDVYTRTSITLKEHQSASLSNLALKLTLNSIDTSRHTAAFENSVECSGNCSTITDPVDLELELNVPTLTVSTGYTYTLTALSTSSATVEIDADAKSIGAMQEYIRVSKLPKPVITSIMPSSGPVGTKVTITGTNLSEEKYIQFLSSQLAAADISNFSISADGNQITFSVPTTVHPADNNACLSEPCPPPPAPIATPTGTYKVSLWGHELMAVPDSNVVMFTVTH